MGKGFEIPFFIVLEQCAEVDTKGLKNSFSLLLR